MSKIVVWVKPNRDLVLSDRQFQILRFVESAVRGKPPVTRLHVGGTRTAIQLEIAANGVLKSLKMTSILRGKPSFMCQVGDPFPTVGRIRIGLGRLTISRKRRQGISSNALQ